MQRFIEYLENQGIEKEIGNTFIKNVNMRQYSKEQILLHMGEQSQSIYFILQGLVRGFYVNEEGMEVTKCFSKENDWCCVYNMLRKEPSEYWIETLEDCELIEFNIHELQRLILPSRIREWILLRQV
ncbi:MAG: cyclic nucleotide-binding domain-containing protein [Cellulosilyticum sp.]|nr:cyclic nucleotide-binding domain-containing protein [Cellulosilyticum sp.]